MIRQRISKYSFLLLLLHFNIFEVKKTIAIIIIKQVLFVIILFCGDNVSYAQIAIVVNKENPVNNLSFQELQNIYLGEITSFSRGNTIVLGVNADLKQKFITILLKWPELNYKKHWMKMIFSGESHVAPKELERTEELNTFISQNRGSIAFIDITKVDKDLKIITIDGKEPGSKDYPLN